VRVSQKEHILLGAPLGRECHEHAHQGGLLEQVSQAEM